MERSAHERLTRSPQRTDNRLSGLPNYDPNDIDRLRRENEELRGIVQRQNEQQLEQQNSMEAALRQAKQRYREQQIELKAYSKYIDDLENKLVELSKENDQMRKRLEAVPRHPVGDSQYAQLIDEVERWRLKFAAADTNHQQELEQQRKLMQQEAEDRLRELMARRDQEKATFERQIQQLRALLLKNAQRGSVQPRLNTSVNVPNVREISPNSSVEGPNSVQPRSRIVSLQEQFQELRSKVKRVEQRNEEILERIKHKKSIGERAHN